MHYYHNFMNLHKETQPHQVKRPWDVEVKVGDRPAIELPPEVTSIELFDRDAIAGKLLILGAPGSGKTTTLLELARALIARSETHTDEPLPVLFNLSTWKGGKQTLAQWLTIELKEKYGVRKDIGQHWVQECQLLPLLDGLDELPSEHQEPCVAAINQWLASEERPHNLVVCSRFEEYELYRTKLNLNGAIHLQPLTAEQIQNYLNTLGNLEIWAAIQPHEQLSDLARSPFLLSILGLIPNEAASLNSLLQLQSSEAAYRELLDRYIQIMFDREIKNRWYHPNKAPEHYQTKTWLSWIAKRLNQENTTEFLIEKIQPSWLNKTWKEWVYHSSTWFANSWLFSFSLIPIILVSTFITVGYWKLINSNSNPELSHTLSNINIAELAVDNLITSFLRGTVYGLSGLVVFWLVSHKKMTKLFLKIMTYTIIFGFFIGHMGAYLRIAQAAEQKDIISSSIFYTALGAALGCFIGALMVPVKRIKIFQHPCSKSIISDIPIFTLIVGIEFSSKTIIYMADTYQSSWEFYFNWATSHVFIAIFLGIAYAIGHQILLIAIDRIKKQLKIAMSDRSKYILNNLVILGLCGFLLGASASTPNIISVSIRWAISGGIIGFIYSLFKSNNQRIRQNNILLLILSFFLLNFIYDIHLLSESGHLLTVLGVSTIQGLAILLIAALQKINQWEKRNSWKIGNLVFVSFWGGFLGSSIYVSTSLFVDGNISVSIFYGFLYGVISAFVYGLIYFLSKGNPYPVKLMEALTFSKKGCWVGMKYGFFLGLPLALAVTLGGAFFEILLFNHSYSTFSYISSVISIVMVSVIIIGIIYGIKGVDINRKVIPNQGIRQTLANAALIGGIGFTVGLAIGSLALLFPSNLPEDNLFRAAAGPWKLALLALLTFPATCGVVFGLIASISGIKHLILRIILWWGGESPWNYARFLNYATERMLLQRVGGRYRFIHRLLQDRFAQMVAARK